MRAPRIEVYADKSGAWRWRCVASNGRITAASGESFASKSNARRAAKVFFRSIARSTFLKIIEVVEQ